MSMQEPPPPPGQAGPGQPTEQQGMPQQYGAPQAGPGGPGQGQYAGGGQHGGYMGGPQGGGVGMAMDYARRNITTPETKPFFLTSEFIAYILSIAALAIATGADDNLTAPTLWILITVLTVAYMISRGLSKTASRRSRLNGGGGDVSR